jgi:hypothetical protein
MRDNQSSLVTSFVCKLVPRLQSNKQIYIIKYELCYIPPTFLLKKLMSLFRGLITINVGDSLEPEAGIAAIKQALQRSHRVQFYDLPKKFIDEFQPYLDNRRVQLFLPAGVNKPDWLDSEEEHLPSRVQAEYYGRNMYVGGINLASQTFDVLWSRGKVYDISRLRQDKCLRCSIRREIRHLDDRPNVRMGSVISQDTHDEFIRTELNYSDEGIIANIPPSIIEKFLPLIRKQNFRLLLPTKTDFRPDLATKGGVRALPRLAR